MSQTRLLEDGQKIVFVGDSITAAPEGYVKIVEHMLGALAPDLSLTCVNAGVGGNQIGDLHNRLGDIIVEDPDWVTLSIGINDVYHGVNGTPIEQFRDLYDEVVRRLQKQTVARVALLTTTVIGENLDGPANLRLIPYNDFIRETARKRKALLVPVNEAFHIALSAYRKATGSSDLHFTTDDVHMSPVGDHLMALTLLRAWGILQ